MVGQGFVGRATPAQDFVPWVAQRHAFPKWAGKQFLTINLVPRPIDTGNADNVPTPTPAIFYDPIYDIAKNGSTDPAWLWLKRQIDEMWLLGFNCVRIILDPSVRVGDVSHNGPATFRGTVTQAELNSFLHLLITYVDGKGDMYLYPALMEPQSADPLTGSMIAQWVTEVITKISDPAYTNVIGADIMQEHDRSTYATTGTNLNTIMATARAASLQSATAFPMTSSLSSFLAWGTGIPRAALAGVNFLDLHNYVASDAIWLNFELPNVWNLPVIVGETGIGTWGGFFNVAITSIGTGNPALVTTLTPHGMDTGNVAIFGGTNSTPSADGPRVVTVASATTFTIPLNVTVSGSAGAIGPANQETSHPFSSERRSRHAQGMGVGFGLHHGLQLMGWWGAADEFPADNQNWGLINLRYAIASVSVANPTTVTTDVPHNLTSGDTVVIQDSTSTPSIDGSRVVTVTGASTFTVPVNVTNAGTASGLVGVSKFPTSVTVRTEMSDPLATIPRRKRNYDARFTLPVSGANTTIASWSSQSDYMLGWAQFDYSDRFSRLSNKVRRATGAFTTGVVNLMGVPALKQYVRLRFTASNGVASSGEIDWCSSVRHQGLTATSLNHGKFYMANVISLPGTPLSDGILTIWKIDGGATQLASMVGLQPFNLTHVYDLIFTASPTVYPTALQAILKDVTAGTTLATLSVNDSSVNLQNKGLPGIPATVGAVDYDEVEYESTDDPGPSVDNLVVTPTSATAVDLSWSAATGGIAPYAYVAQYAPANGNKNPTADWISVGVPSGTSINLSGLTPGTNYVFRIYVIDSSS